MTKEDIMKINRIIEKIDKSKISKVGARIIKPSKPTDYKIDYKDKFQNSKPEKKTIETDIPDLIVELDDEL